MTFDEFTHAVEAAARAAAALSLCPEELHVHTPTRAAVEAAREVPGARFTRYGAARTSHTGCLTVAVTTAAAGVVRVTLHGVTAAAAPRKLTKPQLEGLRVLGDGRAHEGATVTAHGWIGGGVATALIGLGYAERVSGSTPSAYVITAAGKARLAQETGPDGGLR